MFTRANIEPILSGMRNVALIVTSLLAVTVVSSSAQSAGAGPVAGDIGSQLLRVPHLQEIPGAVPVHYVPSARERAIQYQNSLVSADEWFETQLKVHVPMELFVLNHEAYGKIEGSAWPLPYNTFDSALKAVVFPDRVEELVGQEKGAKLPGEYIAFHEGGHIIASAIKIESGNAWVNELVANMFMVAYIRAKRPDLDWVLAGPEAHAMKEVPRFTSLRDLDYVYAPGLGVQNYVWFQHQIERLAGFLVADQEFVTVIKQLQIEFPAGSEKQESLDQIVVRLDRIRPGSRDFLGPLYGPTKFARITPVPCAPGDASTKPQSTVIAVQNDSGRPLTVISLDGTRTTLEPASWDDFSLRVGGALKLSNSTCLVGTNEPSLAVISTQ